MRSVDRRFGLILLVLAVCWAASPADGATQPQYLPSLETSAMERAVFAATTDGGLVNVTILGTFSFFACGYGCDADEIAVVIGATDPESGMSGELTVCYDRETEMVSQASRGPSEDPACRYGYGDTP